MKNIQTGIVGKASSIFFLLLFATSTAYAGITIEKVEVESKDHIIMTLSGANLEGKVTGDMKVLKDVKIASALKSIKSDTIVNISLDEALTADTSYSLLSIFGAEGSMDFSLGSVMTNVEFVNKTADGSQLEKLVVKDSKNIDLYYKLGLKSDEFEYKILSSLGVERMLGSGNILDVFTKISLSSHTSYILMLISLTDEKDNTLSLDDEIFDFETGEFADEVNTVVGGPEQINTVVVGKPEEQKTGDVKPLNLEYNTINSVTYNAETNDEDMGTGTTLENPESEGLNVAPGLGEESGETLETTKALGNLEEVAMNTQKTPKAGAETWLILLASLVINSIFFITKRKNKKYA